MFHSKLRIFFFFSLYGFFYTIYFIFKQILVMLIFFFQAEDGIRYYKVTGVQTCALPIFVPRAQSAGSGAFGNVFLSSRYNANVSGLYVAPWDINIGASLLYRQGYPNVLRSAVSGLRGGTATVALEEVGERRFDNVYQLDLRVAKDFRVMDLATFTISADIFNATNERTVLQRNGDVFSYSTAASTDPSTAAAQRITEMQAPRVYRFGGKFTF